MSGACSDEQYIMLMFSIIYFTVMLASLTLLLEK